MRDDCSPYNRANGLHRKQDTYPIACCLILLGSSVENYGAGCIYRFRSAKNISCYRTIGISPHEHKSCPAEELYKTYCPKCLWSLNQQLEHIGILFFLIVLADSMVLGIKLGRIFLNLSRRIDYTQYKDGGTYIKRVDYRIRNYSFRCYVADSNGSKQEWEDISGQATCIAQETLDGVGQPFLLFVHHIAYHHLERLHGHVDGSVEEHQRHQTKYHGGSYRHPETTGIRQKTHYGNGYQSPYKQIRYSASESCPSAVAHGSDDGLDDDSCQRR